MEHVKVIITQEGVPDHEQKLEVRKGMGLQAICLRHATPIEYDCREADCGICLIRVEEGADQLSPRTKAEEDFLTAMRARPSERLACQARVMGDVKICVPEP